MATPQRAETAGRRGRRREEVLRTAARIFAEMGYRGATLEDIAKALNVTQPALYYYARSKDELLGECGEIAMQAVRQAFEDAEHQPTGLEQLRTFFRGWAEILCDDFGRCFALTDARELSDERAASTALNQKSMNQSVEAMIRRGVEDGSIALRDPADLRRVLFSAFDSVPRWYRPTGGRSAGEIADELMDIFTEGMRPRER